MPQHLRPGRLLRGVLTAALAAAFIYSAAFSAFAEDVPGNDRVMGDLDGDGMVSSFDALTILRSTVGLGELSASELDVADMDGDGEITANDALAALTEYVKAVQPTIIFPETYTAYCGQRLNLTARMEPADIYGDVKFQYLVGRGLSDDGLTDEDGDPYHVLEITNTGRIKAFHPGTTTIKAVASNGMRAVCNVTVRDAETVKTITSGDRSLKIYTRMMTNNECYNLTDDFEQLDGVVVHSTATPGVFAPDWYSRWNRPGTDAAVHSFLDNNCVYNYLPLDQTAWHAGQPANRTYLDFEICEPSGFYYSGNTLMDYDVQAQSGYFNAIWKNSTLYTAYLCQTYGLTADDVISHAEAGRSGIGTNHGDPDHWFVLHDRDMDDFRRDVAAILNEGVTVTAEKPTSGADFGELFGDTYTIDPADIAYDAA